LLRLTKFHLERLALKMKPDEPLFAELLVRGEVRSVAS
jgi:hypothetical protein